jgi:hypothetical protein
MKNISRILMTLLLMLPFTLLRAESNVMAPQQEGKTISVLVSDAMGTMPGANVV